MVSDVPPARSLSGFNVTIQNVFPVEFGLMFLLLIQVTPVPELFLTAVKLSHDGTGARYLHLAREDTNNLFR